MARLKPLTGLDAGFLYLEASGTPMHVGSLMLLDLPKRRGYDFHRALVRVLGERLGEAPALRRVLVEAPLGLGHPMWTETDRVDLAWHVQRQRVPKPAGMAQVTALVARFHAEMLPRDRPLWRFCVLEGLGDGRIALCSKVHHALLDGQGAVALSQVLLDLEATPRPPLDASELPRGRRVRRRDAATAAWRATVKQFANLVTALPETIKVVGADVGATGATGLLGRLRDSVQLAPRTPFNVQISPKRSYATASLPIAQVKGTAKALGVSLNDVVLAICATAVRDHLIRRKELPKEPLIVAMPVSLRSKGDAESNNQVSMAQCTLATDVADPLVRLRRIAAATARVKSGVGAFRDLIPTDFPGLAAPIWATGLSRLWGMGRISERLPPLANMVVSNVPGPPMELFLAGARLKHCFPVSIVIHGLGFNITVQGYGEHLEFGLIACRTALPNPATIARALQPALDRLGELARHEKKAQENG